MLLARQIAVAEVVGGDEGEPLEGGGVGTSASSSSSSSGAPGAPAGVRAD